MGCCGARSRACRVGRPFPERVPRTRAGGQKSKYLVKPQSPYGHCTVQYALGEPPPIKKHGGAYAVGCYSTTSVEPKCPTPSTFGSTRPRAGRTRSCRALHPPSSSPRRSKRAEASSSARSVFLLAPGGGGAPLAHTNDLMSSSGHPPSQRASRSFLLSASCVPPVAFCVPPVAFCVPPGAFGVPPVPRRRRLGPSPSSTDGKGCVRAHARARKRARPPPPPRPGARAPARDALPRMRFDLRKFPA